MVKSLKIGQSAAKTHNLYYWQIKQFIHALKRNAFNGQSCYRTKRKSGGDDKIGVWKTGLQWSR